MIKKRSLFFCDKKLLFFACFIFFPCFSLAEGSGLKEVAVQLFNFSVFFGLLWFLLKKPAQAFFHKRQKNFLSFEEQALKIEKEKKEELTVWDQKLKALTERESGIKEKAQEEGKKLDFQKKEELKSLKIRLKKEADFFLNLEKEQAKNLLLKKGTSQIARSAGWELKNLAKSPSFQKESMKDFFKQIKAHL